MFTRRVPSALFVVVILVSSGCQSTPTTDGGGVKAFVANLFARKQTTMAMTGPVPVPVTQQTPSQAQVFLNPGMEVQWQAADQNEPGQVNKGRAMIGPDGTVVVGPYGTCKVAGLTLDQATIAIENHLSAYMKTPNVQLSAVVGSNTPDLAFRSARLEPTETVVRPVTFQR